MVFEDKTIRKINFTPNWIKTLWTSPTEHLDVTLIELSTDAISILSRTQIARFNTATALEKGRIFVYLYISSLYSIECVVNGYYGMIETSMKMKLNTQQLLNKEVQGLPY